MTEFEYKFDEIDNEVVADDDNKDPEDELEDDGEDNDETDELSDDAEETV